MSRSAVLKYKEAQIAPEQAGREMNVAAVLSENFPKAMTNSDFPRTD
jgi:hypothetical protein